MITIELKNKVVAEIRERRTKFAGSDAKYSISLGINNAVYSRMMAGEVDKILSDANWISLARLMSISLKNEPEWKTALTRTYIEITTKLEKCQEDSLSSMICDATDIGKTYTAMIYAKTHMNAKYIDCSQVKSKQKLVRHIAKEFGVGNTGKYNDVYEDLVFYLRSITNPIIILDEAGDLDYSAFLELKAMWNATERCCGWMMMGAEALQEKIRRGKDCKKVGYAEIFSRYGNRYQFVTPQNQDERKKFTQQQAALIIKANAPEGTDTQKILYKTEGSLRRIRTEISKLS